MSTYQRFLFSLTEILYRIVLILCLLAALFFFPPVAMLFGTPGEAAAVHALSLSLFVLSLGFLLVRLAKGMLKNAASLAILLTALGALLVFVLRPVTNFTREGYLFPLAVMLTVPRALFTVRTPPLPPSRVAARWIGLLLFLTGLLALGGLILQDPLWQTLLLRMVVLPFAFLSQLLMPLLNRPSRSLAVIGALLPLPLAAAIFLPNVIYAFPLLAVIFVGILIHTNRQAS
ncbi:MAG: hypothetical protein E7618_00955 [Ruminococcaceae bacterium]|nr:hypothetical protein [Oscillospiraceae bacterium]